MFDKMKQLYDMQKQAKQMKKSVEATKVEKASSDGKLRLVINGAFQVESLSIDETYLAPAQRAGLEKALRDLFNDAASDVGQQSAAQAMDMMKQFNIKLPGF